MYYGCPIIYREKLFNSAIQLISWHKCRAEGYRAQIELSTDPMQAGYFGTPLGRTFLARHNKGIEYSLRKDWPTIAQKTMAKIVRLKFDQNPNIRSILLQTQDQHLQENEQPVYWEDGAKRNRYGRLLMKLRSTYQEQEV